MILGTTSIHSSEINNISRHILFQSLSGIPCRVSTLIPTSLTIIPFHRCDQTEGYDPDHPEISLVPPLAFYPTVYVPPGQDGYDYAPYDLPADLAPVHIEPHSSPPAPADDGVVGEPYDSLDDFDGFMAGYFRDPLEGAPAPMDEDPAEDPVVGDDQDIEMGDTYSEDEDPSEDEEPSTSSGGRPAVSTDTRESHV
ncbi:hypothetical protein PIB30_090145 [Stylosanthes scabra]|uniref:Uncharacterized protein n=1 Tax=Stylosanthes scabra TaxID=79078 RepID=A0ABU6ZSV4_9FABA|nr:hypothetical protein [Stylosanthes scabra]